MTINQTFGLKTGKDMDKYLRDDIKNDDIYKYGQYDSFNYDIVLTLCPEGCGAPLIGHTKQ